MAVTNFEKIISVLNIENRVSLEQEIKKRYTPKLFSDDELIDRSSLEGWAIDIIREWTSLDNESKKWKHLFRRAFSSLSDDYADELKLTFEQRIELFELEFQYKNASFSELNDILLSEDQSSNQSIPIHWTKNPRYLRKMSLLREWDKEHADKIDSQVFENLFHINQHHDLYTEDYSALFSHVVTYLNNFFPAEAQEISFLLEGASYNAEQLNQCIARGFESSKQERALDLQNLSEKLAYFIKELQIGEKKLIFCPVKETSPNIHLSHLLQDSVYINLFENAINHDKSAEIVESLVNKIEIHIQSLQETTDLDKITDQVQHLLEEGVTRFLFSKINDSYFNDNQTCLEKITFALPELLRLSLQAFLTSLEKDVVDKISEHFPLNSTKELCLDLCIASKEGYIEEVLHNQLKPFLEKHLKKMTHHLRVHFFSLTNDLPPVASEMFTLLDLGHLGAPKSHLWLEFERQKDDRFNLFIYTSGKGVAVQGVVPLIYKDLSVDQLNVDFFLRLVSFIALNQWEEDSFDLQDIHKGLFLPLDIDPSVPEGIMQSIGTEVQDIQTVWGVLKALLSTKLNFATEQERELFFYTWQKKVLIDYCLLYQESSSFKKDVKKQTSICLAAKALSKKALELFNHKKIDFEELQKVYATTWEILEVFQEKPIENHQKFKPHILPMPILEAIHSLFTQGYKNATLLRNVIVDVLGDEVKASLDAILDDLSIPIEISEETAFEIEIEGDFYRSDRRWINLLMDMTLGFDLDDLEKPNTFSYIKIAFNIARIAVALILSEYALLFMGGWAVLSVAKAALAHFIKDAYPEEYQVMTQKAKELSDYLEVLRIKMILKAACFLFLEEELRQNLIDLIQTWQAYLTHDGKLSFEVDPLPEPQQSTLEITNVTISIKLANQVEKETQLFDSMVSPIIKIDERTCFDFLLTQSVVEHPDEKVIRHLPSPLDDCWGKVENPQKILELLSLLTFHFYSTPGNLAKDRAVHAIICLFKCYAIIDKLARRCPEAELNGYLSNPFALVYLKKNAFFQIKDGHFLSEFIDICTYFRIDYDKDYSDGEFASMIQGSLFKVNSKQTKYYQSSFPEKYYETILNKPGTPGKLKRLNIKEEAVHIDKLAAIYADGRLPSGGGVSDVHFLSRPFHLLRMANLWANEFTTAVFYGRPVEIMESIDHFPGTYYEGDHPIRQVLQQCSFDQFFQKEDTWLPYKILPFYKEEVKSKGIIDIAYRNVLASTSNLDAFAQHHAQRYTSLSKSSALNFYKIANDCFHRPKRKQNDILNYPFDFKKIENSSFKLIKEKYPNALSHLPESERKIIEMIWTDESDQAVRTIAYFSQRLDHLEQPIYRALFDLLLFRRDVLERQLKDDPNFSKTLGDFFHKAINYYTNKKLMPVAMSLMDTSQVCLARLSFKDHLASRHFPHFPGEVKTVENSEIRQGVDESIQFEDKLLMDLQKDKHHLQLLSWFQPLEKILVYRDYKGITDIFFKELNLSFVVATRNGKKYAEGTGELSGFFMAEEQRSSTISSLSCHSRYLLLKNHQNQYKVILLSETLCAMAGLWFVNQFVPFSSSHLLDQYLDKTLKPLFSEMAKEQVLPEYYVYTVDERGKLYSEDALALLHLLMHALAHDLSESLIDYVILIERIGRQFPFSKEIFQYIKLVHVAALASQDPLLLRISLRLAAIVEENGLIQIHPEPPASDSKESMLEWIVLQINYFRYLKEPDASVHLPLDEYHELFIMQAMNRRAGKILGGMDHFSEAEDLMKNIDQNYIVKALLMPPQISQRQAFLKAKYENQEKEVSLDFVYDTVKEKLSSGLLSDVKGKEPGMQETLIQNLLRGLSLKKIEKLFLSLPFCEEKYSENQNPLESALNLLKTAWVHIPIHFMELTQRGLNHSFFYYYQLATGEPPQSLQSDQLEAFKQKSEVFKQSLQIVQGKKMQRHSLLLILQLVSQSNGWVSFPSLQDLEKKLVGLIKEPFEPYKKSLMEFEDHVISFKKHILKICYAYLAAPSIKKGIQSIGKALSLHLRSLYSSGDLGISGVMTSFPLGWGVYKGLQAVDSLMDTYNRREKMIEIAAEERKHILEKNQQREEPLPELLLKRMEEEDQRLAAFPKKLLQDHFKPLKVTRKVPKSDKGKEELVEGVAENQHGRCAIKPLVCPSKDPFIQKEFDCFNRELIEGRNRLGDQEYPHEPFEVRDYFEMKHALKKEIKRRQNFLKELRETLLKFEKESIQLSEVDYLSQQLQEQNKTVQKSLILDSLSKFNRLMKAFINNEESCTGQKPLFYLYLVISTRTQQLMRGVNLLNKIDPVGWQQDETKVLFREVGFELGRDRAYPLNRTLPTKLLRGYLAFEEGKGLMLWEKLVRPLQRMLLDESSNIISQMSTGVGKTTCEKPLSTFFSSGRVVIANIFPDALAAENMRDLGACSYKVFGKLLNGFSGIRRRMTVDQLWALEMLLKRSQDHQESLNARKQDFQTLRQLFIEEIYQANQNPKEINKSLIWGYMKVCRFIREHVKANIDEVNAVIHYSKVQNHPFGEPRRIKEEYITVIFACMRLLFTIPEIERRVPIATNDQTLCPPEMYKTIVKPLLATGLCAYKPFNIQSTQKKRFIEYLCGKSQEIPDFVLNHPRKQEIFLCVGLLNDILPKTLNQRINVDFGIEGNPYGYAQLYAGKDTPVIGAILKNPIEAVVKTIICWRFIPLTAFRTKNLMIKMVDRAKQEVEKKGINFEETKASALFSQWTQQHYQLKTFMDSHPGDALERITEFFNQSYAAKMSYAVIPIEHIFFYLINMFCSSYNAVSMFRLFNGSTATTNIEELSPNRTKILREPGTIGGAIYLVDQADITVLKNRVPEKAYKELLERDFQWGSKNIAVIDGSALFNGLKNEKASSIALDFIKQSRPDLEAVVYYQENASVIQGVDKGSVPFNHWNLPPDRRITYYDATHSIGADFKQPIGTVGSVSVSEIEIITNLVQALGRMRGTKNLQQSIALFTNEAAKKVMTKNEKLTSRDVMAHLQMNEAQKNKEGVFPSARQQVDDFLSSVVYDAMIFAGSVDEAMKFAVHLSFFIEEANYEDMTAYGLPKAYKDGRFAFQEYCNRKYEPIKNSPVFTAAQKQEIYSELLKIGTNFTFPRVKLPVRQGKIHFSRHDVGFSQQLSVELAQSQGVHQQQNQNVHQNQDLFVNLNKKSRQKLTLRSESPKWDPDFDYFSSLDWLGFEEKESLHRDVEVYRVCDSLAFSKGQFSFVSQAFKGNLFWTNGLRGILSDSTLAPVFSIKPILQLLVIKRHDAKDDKSRYITCGVDQEDAHFWRNLLAQNVHCSKRAGPYKIVLYDLALDAIVMAGKDPILLSELRGNPYVQFDLARWKFMAGHPNFQRKMIEKMEKWINKYDKNNMKLAFEEIYKVNGFVPLEDSHIMEIFSVENKEALPDLFI